MCLLNNTKLAVRVQLLLSLTSLLPGQVGGAARVMGSAHAEASAEGTAATTGAATTDVLEERG